MIRRQYEKAKTLWRLGIANVLRVAVYRLGLRTGLHPATRISSPVPAGPFFAGRASVPPAGVVARDDWREVGLAFGHLPVICSDDPPDWHANVIGGGRGAADAPWHRIPDFDGGVGDIKGVWETSRFDWLIAMTQRAALGEGAELHRVNLWLEDWARANPPYHGVNWKCAQEASIRVLHLALGAIILDQVDAPPPGLMRLLRVHLDRIKPTTAYAIAQDNNHGTSEAAALFVGGSWLERQGVRKGRQFAQLGRHMLAERAQRLIAPDGSFSQYSLVYHRLMLDTYSFAECWRRRLELAEFDGIQRDRLSAATRWLQLMVNPVTGDAPNLGANDGAQLFKLENSGHRDFRPSLQWAAALFLNSSAIAQAGDWDQRLHWLGIEKPPTVLAEAKSTQLDHGGYHVAHQGSAMACLRYPRFRFRPSQSDALHLDLWVDGENLLRDGGTFGYNCSRADIEYFGGTASHNTAMFDDRDQMPRLGRFLFGDWLDSSVAEMSEDKGGTTVRAAYTDRYGANHDRIVRLECGKLEVLDRLGGSARNAVIRWRLPPGDWQFDGNCVRHQSRMICVEPADSSQPIPTLAIVEGEESRYYGARSTIPVLEVQVSVPSAVLTTVKY